MRPAAANLAFFVAGGSLAPAYSPGMTTLKIISWLLTAWLPWHLVAAAETPPAQSRLGMNLSGIVDWNTEHPFVDVFRLSRQWISQKQGQSWGKGPQLDLDEHGWIRKLGPDCFAETPILTGGHAPAGDYVCLFNGEGQIEFGANSKVVERAAGRLVVTIEGRKAGTFLSIRQTNPQNPVRNIRLIMPGLEKNYRSPAQR